MNSKYHKLDAGVNNADANQKLIGTQESLGNRRSSLNDDDDEDFEERKQTTPTFTHQNPGSGGIQ